MNIPQTNMEIADLINQRLPTNDAPYFDRQIHDYLLSKGAHFQQLAAYRLAYYFTINGEMIRMVFFTDLDQGNVRIQYWWEEEGTETELPVAKWLTHDLFSIPVGYNSLNRFKQILFAYIETL